MGATSAIGQTGRLERTEGNQTFVRSGLSFSRPHEGSSTGKQEPITESLSQTSFPYGITAHYRPNTSDERVLREVITKAAYRRPTLGFDVRPGEVWLDLGANIGAFALYCKMKGATAVCYEPDPDNFELLSMNVPEFEKHNVAITAQPVEWVAFWKGRSLNDHYRATAVPSRTLPRHPYGILRNEHADY